MTNDNYTIRTKIDPTQWVDAYADQFFAYTIEQVKDITVTENLIKETFLTAINSFKKTINQSSEQSWLESILKSKVVDYQNEISVNTPSNKRSVSSLNSTEAESMLLTYIKNLPTDQAMVFAMKTVYNYSVKDICKELKLSTSDFWELLHQARLSITKQMKKKS